MKAGKIVITPRGFAKCGIDNVEIMEKAGYEVIYNDTGSAYTKDEFYKITEEAVGIIVGVEQVDRTYIDAHPKLKAAVKFGVGVDNFDLEYCKEKNIFVGRTVGSNSRSVAETAISFVIADSKNLFQSLSETKNHGWSKMTGYEVQGKSIGIIGFGAIGREVAKMAYGLGMQVFCFDAFGIDKEFASKYEVKEKSVEEIIKTSDFLSLHVPLTEETKNLITRKELKQMKSNAVLINTARGGIVNESDLYEVLKSHMIRAAYFDVFTCEPPKEEEPLLQLDNFYLTPHIASRSAEAEKRSADIATKVLLEALD